LRVKTEPESVHIGSSLQKRILKVLSGFESNSANLIPTLQALQYTIGYLPKEAIVAAAEKLGVPVSHAYGVATFYHQFRLKPAGRHQVYLCFGTACHVKGASSVFNAFLKVAGMSEGEATSKDGRFTLNKVRCLGACSMAPIVKIDSNIYGRMNPSDIRKVSSKYR